MRAWVGHICPAHMHAWPRPPCAGAGHLYMLHSELDSRQATELIEEGDVVCRGRLGLNPVASEE